MAKKPIAPKPEKVKFLFKRSDARKEELRRLYDRLIDRGRTRTKLKGVHDNHHILPISLGGSDNKENISVLTYDEHFLAHYLLALITSGPARHKMLFAMDQLTWMCKSNVNRKVTRRQYALARKAHAEARSEYFSSLSEEEKLSHGNKISLGMARWREELGEDAYEEWCVNKCHRGENHHFFGVKGSDHPGSVLKGPRNGQWGKPGYFRGVTGPDHPGWGRRGEKSQNAKLTQAQADEIRRLASEEGHSTKELAKVFGVSPETVRVIRKNERYIKDNSDAK